MTTPKTPMGYDFDKIEQVKRDAAPAQDQDKPAPLDALLRDLVSAAVWENYRAVKQALRGERNPHTTALWETCFGTAFKPILERHFAGLLAGTHVVVPREPTRDMLVAYCNALENPAAAAKEMWHHTKARKRYRAMIEASQRSKP